MCKKLFIFFYLIFIFPVSYAVEPLPNNLVPFSSVQGSELIKRDLNPTTLKLLSHFTTQKTVAYCGIASAVMILNSSNIVAPRDPQHPSYNYFTQDNFLNQDVEKVVSLEVIQKNGITLSELSQVIQCHGLKAVPFYADDLTLYRFRVLLKTAITNQQFVIVNYLRTELELKGGGHHSPIAAYDEKTDRFLVLDVSRYKYPAYWVKTSELWKAVHTKDKASYHGVIIVSNNND